MSNWRNRYNSHEVVWWDDKRVEECEVCISVEKNLISVGALEAQDLKGTLREGVLKMSSSSEGYSTQQLVLLKG